MSPAFTRSRAGLLLALTAGSGISPPGAPARTPPAGARAPHPTAGAAVGALGTALGASVSARPGAGPGRAHRRTSRGVDDPPQVWITPEPGTVAPGPLSATVHWCDDTGFLSGTRRVTLDGVTLSSTFAVSASPGCAAHATSEVSLNLTPGAHTLAARITDRGGNVGTGEAAYTAAAAATSPSVTIVSPTLYRDPALCALDCGELVQAVSTPAYVSRDVPRSLTLVYRSGRAHPLPIVELDAAGAPAGTATLGLTLTDAAGTPLALRSGGTEVVRAYAAGVPNRLAAQIDGAGLGLVTTLTAVVTAYDAAGAVLGRTPTPVRVLVDVLHGPASPYGAGWGVAGVQQFRWADPSYSPTGGLVIVDGDGTIGYWAYASTSGGTIAFASPAGDATVVTYDAATQVLTRRYPDGGVVRLSAVGGIEISAADRLGNATTFAYNAQNLLSAVTDPAGHRLRLGYRDIDYAPNPDLRPQSLATVADPAGRTMVWVVGTNGHVEQADPGAGSVTRTYLAAAGHIYQVTDPRGGVWNYTYDALGQLLTATTPGIATDGGARRLTTAFGTWAAGVLVFPGAAATTPSQPAPALASGAVRATVTDAQTGLQTRYALDRWGAAARVEAPGGVVATAERDANGNVTRTVDARGQAVDYVWNAARPWLLDSTYDAAAKVGTRYTYDPARDYALQTVVVNGQEQQRVWTRTDGRVDSVRAGGAGQAPTRYKYLRPWDARPDTVVDPRAHKTAYAYSAGGLQNAAGVTSALGTSSVVRDAYGRDSVAIDPLGRRTTVTYDLLNRPLTVTDPAGQTTTTAYDALFPRTVTDAVGQVYRDSVNALGAPVSGVDPAGRATQTAYDAAGRVSQVTNRRGQTVTFGYDPALGHLASRATSDGYDAAYGGDALGRVRWAGNAESVDSVLTDSLGRDTLAVHRIPALPQHRYVVQSTYDSLGRRHRVQLLSEGPGAGGSAGVAEYRYGAAGQLEAINPFDAATTFYYNDELVADSVRLGNGVVVRDGRTAGHALASRRYSVPALDAALGRLYGYDQAGRVYERYNPARTARRTYQYDLAGRLRESSDATRAGGTCTPDYSNATGPRVSDDAPTRWSCPGESTLVGEPRTWTWDAVGNPTGGGAVVTPNSGNRLAQLGDVALQYDDDGHLVARSHSGSAVQSLQWNSLGQLVAAQTNDPAIGVAGNATTFGYDGWGRRVRKTNTTTGATTYFVWDGDDLIADVDAAGQVVAHYRHYPGALDQPHSVAVARAGVSPSVYYYATERPGHVVGLVDANRALAARYAYQPFGVADTVSEAGLGGWTNRLRYGAREYDAETGLYYHRARYYDPRLARFISQDPIGLAGGVNPYAYAGNDPVNATDPTGLQCIELNGSGDRVTGDGASRDGATLPPVRVCGGSTPSPAPVGPTFTDAGRPAGAAPDSRGGRGVGRRIRKRVRQELHDPCFRAQLDIGITLVETLFIGTGVSGLRTARIAYRSADASVRRLVGTALANPGDWRVSMQLQNAYTSRAITAINRRNAWNDVVGGLYMGGVESLLRSDGLGYEIATAFLPPLKLLDQVPKALDACGVK